MSAKPRLRPVEGGKSWQFTTDSFTNFLTRTGIGGPNLSSAGRFDPNTVSRNRMELEWAYRGNWVARTIVDAPAEDMTRAGVEIQSEDSPKDIERIHKGAERLAISTRLCTAIKWARLYGGSLAYLMVDGQNPSTPLDLDSIGRGQFRGVLPLDRWMVWPVTTNIISELGPEFGLPRFYKLWPDSGTGLPITTIHHSRLIRLDGEELPYWQRIAENYWGLSVLEPIWDRILAFDSTTQGAAQLVYKAHLRTVKISGLRQILGTDQVATQGLINFFQMVRMFQSNEGLTLLDGSDEFQVHQYAFGGLSDLLLQFGQQLAGGAKIPMVRFFGQSPAGLNSTGESDWRNYYDNIDALREQRLRSGMEVIYALLYRSELGRQPKSVYTLNFRPLWQMTDEQSAGVTSTVANAVSTLVDKQVFDRPMALKEIRQLSQVTNFGSNVTEDDIAQAEKEAKEQRENPPDPFADPADVGATNPNARRLAERAAGTQSRSD